MTNHEFLNRIRSLYNIDHDVIPELTNEQWIKFRDDPPRYLIKTDKTQVDVIMREVERRQHSQNQLDIQVEGDNTTLIYGASSLTIPSARTGDAASMLDAAWLDWHSKDLIERDV